MLVVECSSRLILPVHGSRTSSSLIAHTASISHPFSIMQVGADTDVGNPPEAPVHSIGHRSSADRSEKPEEDLVIDESPSEPAPRQKVEHASEPVESDTAELATTGGEPQGAATGAEVAAAVTGLLAAPMVAWSLSTLKATGAGS